MKASDFNRRGIKPVRTGNSRIHHSGFPSGFVSRFSPGRPIFKDHGDLMVSRPSPDQLIVAIMAPPTEKDAGKAFLYAAKPLTEADFDWDLSGKRVVTIRSSRFILEQQLDPNWYKVRCE
jgi:hypothetical protein